MTANGRNAPKPAFGKRAHGLWRAPFLPYDGPMMDNASPFMEALALIMRLDPVFLGIVALSLRVTLTAVCLAALIGLPLGALLAVSRFPGRSVAIVAINALMGLPPVVVGLTFFLLLSRSGPLGGFGLLFSPSAMIIAQASLVLPIVIALTRQTIEDLWANYREYLQSIGMGPKQAIMTLLWDARFSLATALLAGFGRATAEVGAVLIVGGNIAGVTRMMTTAIALETSKGDLALALGMGIILVGITLMVNALAFGMSRIGVRHAG